MGRHSCCQKQKLRKGLWSPEEDEKLVQCIASYGHGCWSNVPKLAGLERCGKSCRLRWKNYLRPDLKRGAFSSAEEKLIIDLHAIVGNRWSQIASQLPGRTDNEVKNFWNSCIKKKLKRLGIDPKTHKPIGSMSQNQTDQQANGASPDSESPETSTDLNQQHSQGYKSVAESTGSENYRQNYMQCHEQGKGMVSINHAERACVQDSNVDARQANLGLGWMLPNNAQSFSSEEGIIERFSFSKAPPMQAVHSFPEQQGPMLMLAGAPFNPNGVMTYLGGPHLQVSQYDDSSGCRPIFQLEPKLGVYSSSSSSATNHELQFTPIFNSDSMVKAPEISRPPPPPLPPRLQFFEDHCSGRQIEGPSFMVMDDFGISRGVARGNCYVKSETLDNAVVVQEPPGWPYHIKNGVNEWQVCSPSDLHRIAAALDQI